MDIKYTLHHQEAGFATIPDDKPNTETRSIAYFCEHCGEVWFRAEVLGGKRPWTVKIAPCTSPVQITKEWWYYNYDMFFNQSLVELENLPRAVIERELDILLKEAECCKE